MFIWIENVKNEEDMAEMENCIAGYFLQATEKKDFNILHVW